MDAAEHSNPDYAFWSVSFLVTSMTVVLSSNPPGGVAIFGPWIAQRKIQHGSEAVSHPWCGSVKHWNEGSEMGFAQYLGVRFMPAYRDHPKAPSARVGNQDAYDLNDRALNLLSAINLTESDVDPVCR